MAALTPIERTPVSFYVPVVAAAGGAVPHDRVMDGVNLLPHLGANGPQQPERALFWRDGSYRAVQEQGWKLIVSERPARQWLFNLDRDPTEQHNLAAQQPDRIAHLQALLQAHHAHMPAPLWPSFLELPVAIDKTLDQKESAQDEYTYWIN